MSLVGITHHYPDGTVVEVAVEVDDSFPQPESVPVGRA